jgi:hypothetical protein
MLIVPYAILCLAVAIGMWYIFTEFFITIFNDRTIKKSHTFTCITVTNAIITVSLLYPFVLNFRECLA